MTGIAKFYNKFCHSSNWTRPDPTRGSTRPACNSGSFTPERNAPFSYNALINQRASNRLKENNILDFSKFFL